MSDTIRLLPDAIANQIAAGEVIQRPASVVKELLENALDAQATDISVLLKDAGRTLIQITDNGIGMSPTDARMCFEKHATSKIIEAADLFNLSTLGFRGEALASIAAIAHIELRTRTANDELGTRIVIEGSELKSQEGCSCAVGTSLMVKNLFYNVPARRKFLKSNNAELRHATEEFRRVAMVHPQVQFSMFHNDKPVFQLKATPHKLRIAHLVGTAKYEEKLIAVQEATEAVRISGYVGKPEFARKKRGEQYFFANNRFIKHPYLNHAVEQAYKQLIPDTAYPSYFIFIDVAPEDIDVNIHPTKVEVNFADKQLIYAVLSSAVKKAIGQFSVEPTIDFSSESSTHIQFPKDKIPKMPQVFANPDYNPFVNSSQSQVKPSTVDWDAELSAMPQAIPAVSNLNKIEFFAANIKANKQDFAALEKQFVQIGQQYVVCATKSAMLLIHQQRADERILYEKFLRKFDTKQMHAQQLIFPVNISLNTDDMRVLRTLQADIEQFGFRVDFMGNSQMVVNAAPADVKESQIQAVFDEIINDFGEGRSVRENAKLSFARGMARRLSIKCGVSLNAAEMEAMVNALFACEVPDLSLEGQRIWKTISVDVLKQLFES